MATAAVTINIKDTCDNNFHKLTQSTARFHKWTHSTARFHKWTRSTQLNFQKRPKWRIDFHDVGIDASRTMKLLLSKRLIQRRHLRIHVRQEKRSYSIPSVCSSFVDNEFVSVHDGDENDSKDTFINRAPFTGKALCRVQIPSESLVDFAVASSKVAVSEWSNLASADRGQLLSSMACTLQQHEEDLIHLEALDTGIPISQVRVNHVPYAIQTLEYYAALAISYSGGRERTFETLNSFSFTSRQALGVCAAIGAWNYPLVSMVWKVAPALACGNAVIYKPSECTPLSALHVATLWRDILPPGILQVLVGEADTARQLVRHVDIVKVSVTGSVETGISVAQEAASTLKRTTLELGGKSPLLVFQDADLDSAIRVAIEGNFINNGQVCSNCTRVFVQRDLLDDFLSQVVARLSESTVMGDNMLAETNMGPLMMPPRYPSRHYERVMGFIEQAKQDANVELIHGGRGHQAENGSYFVEPTVFLSKNDDARIVQEEVFGPVMTVLSFDTEEEAIARANDSPFGLAAGVMTRDIGRAHRVSRQLEAGNVWVNNWNACPVEMPFGPFKMSGYGNELGIEALQSYSQTKHTYMELDTVTDESTFFKPR